MKENREKEEKMKPRISRAVVRRLPKYYRYLTELEEKGEDRISSAKLSKITGFTASQIRQDLNHFGGFGQQGYGYNIESLRLQIARIIGMDRSQRVGIIGIGNMGKALAHSNLFTKGDYQLTALFDQDQRKVGKSLQGIEISSSDDLAKVIKEKKLDILTITTPSDPAQKIAEIAVEAGIKGIWNFAIRDLVLPRGVVLENVYLIESLHTLTYYIHHPDDYQGA